MTKQRQSKEEEQEQADFQEGMVEELVEARKLAKTIFECDPSPQVVERVFDILGAIGEPGEELAKDIAWARDRACEVFETKAPTPEQVLCVFTKVFINEDDDD